MAKHWDSFLSHCTCSVHRATWHPSSTLLTTSGSDGKVIIWDTSSSTPTQEKIMDNIIPTVSNTESPKFTHNTSAIWHPSRQYFFLARRQWQIQLYPSGPLHLPMITSLSNTQELTPPRTLHSDQSIVPPLIVPFPERVGWFAYAWHCHGLLHGMWTHIVF